MTMKTLDARELKAAQELLARKEAGESLLEFTKYTFPEFVVGPHHRLMCELLESVERGEKRRVMIFMPPRYSKSEINSRRFPAYFLGRNPDKFVICASYNQDLADDFGRDVRQIVSSSEYHRVFPDIRLDPAVSAMDHWRLEGRRGRYIASGVGTSITGRGAHLFLIDDPFKDRRDADSAHMRELVWNWYKAVAFTRLQPKGAIILIMTRWHDDDLAGRLIEQAQLDDRIQPWEIISLPTEAEENDPLGRKPGEVLWPDWYSAEEVQEQKAVMGEREWASLHQQKPIRDEGDTFQLDWFQRYETLPPHDTLRFYGASDYATDDSSRDYTVHGVFAIDPDANIYVVDWYRRKAKALDWIEALIDLMMEWKPSKWFEEKGQILNMADPLIRKRMKERSVFCYREAFHMSTKKADRAVSIAGRAQMEMIWLPKRAPWVGDLLHELTRFPAGANDDQVDVCSLLGRGLGDLRPGRRKHKMPEDVKPSGRSFNDLLKRHENRMRGRDSSSEAPVVGNHPTFTPDAEYIKMLRDSQLIL